MRGRAASGFPATRYERAHEFMDGVKGLRDSFEDDVFSRNKETGVYFDPQKLHKLNHLRKHLKGSGPLNMERPTQGHPVIVQAGSSEDGKELAAATAEAILTAWTSLAKAQAFYADVKGRLAKRGRSHARTASDLARHLARGGPHSRRGRCNWAALRALALDAKVMRCHIG